MYFYRYVGTDWQSDTTYESIEEARANFHSVVEDVIFDFGECYEEDLELVSPDRYNNLICVD